MDLARQNLFAGTTLALYKDADVGLSVPNLLLEELRPDIDWKMASPVETIYDPRIEYLYLLTTCEVDNDLDDDDWRCCVAGYSNRRNAQLDMVEAACSCLRQEGIEVLHSGEYRTRKMFLYKNDPLRVSLI